MQGNKSNRQDAFQMETNTVNNVLESLKEVEEAIARHRKTVLEAKDQLNRESGESHVVSDGSEKDGLQRKKTPQHKTHPKGDDYKRPTACHVVNHPSKNAVSSLALAETFRKEHDCKFQVMIQHDIPLVEKKSVWVGGYTAWGNTNHLGVNTANTGVQGHIRPCPYIDFNSGVYTCSSHQMYEFHVTMNVSGNVDFKACVCRDRDGLREVVGNQITKVKPATVPHPAGAVQVYNQNAAQNAIRHTVDGRVKWHCEKNDQIWLEAMVLSNGEATLHGVTFEGYNIRE